MVGDQEQMRFYPATRRRDEAAAWIDRNIALYEEHGFGFWLLSSRDSGEFVGYAGIRPTTIGGVEEIEMGWHTRKHFWGQGLATQAAAACKDLAFGRFGITRLVATIDPTNTPSLKVAEKVGMEREKEAVLDGWPCLTYSVRRPSASV